MPKNEDANSDTQSKINGELEAEREQPTDDLKRVELSGQPFFQRVRSSSLIQNTIKRHSVKMIKFIQIIYINSMHI